MRCGVCGSPYRVRKHVWKPAVQWLLSVYQSTILVKSMGGPHIGEEG